MPPATTTKAPAPKPLNVTGTPTPGKISPSPSADSAAEGSTGLAPAAGLIKAEDISSPHELTAFVESLLGQLETRFDDMSQQVLEKMTQMSNRVDTLEASIQDLINGDISSAAPPSAPQSPAITRQATGSEQR